MAHHDNLRTFVCSDCPKSYNTKTDLTQHLKIHGKTDNFNKACDECGKQFTSKVLFHRHRRSHNPPGSKYKQKCKICNVYFVWLADHIKTVHEKVRNFSCDICKKSFGKKSGLTSHKATVHDKIRVFSCDLCYKTFGHKQHAMKHRLQHTKILALSPQELHDQKKLFKCEFCKNCYRLKSSLAKHRRLTHKIFTPVADVSTIRDKIVFAGEDDTRTQDVEGVFLCADDENELKNEVDHFDDSYVKDGPFYFKIDILDDNLDVLSTDDMQMNMFQDIVPEITSDLKNKQILNEIILPNEIGIFEVEINNIVNNRSDSEEEDLTKERIPCDQCDKTYSSQNYLLKHMKTIHNKSELLECDLCKLKFSNETNLNKHKRKFHAGIFSKTDKFGQCPKCYKQVNKYYLKRHFLKCGQEVAESGKMECDKCFKLFKDPEAFKYHKRYGHHVPRDLSTMLKPYKCPLCGRDFGSKSGLDRHIYQHENNTLKSFGYKHLGTKCSLCDEQFLDRLKRDKHWYQVHDNGKITMRKCYYCNSEFKLFIDFRVHVESHDDIHICLICGHFFADDQVLQTHMQTHKRVDVKSRPFECDICGHRMTFKNQLTIHMRNHMKDRHEYVCHICGKNFKHYSVFLYHKRRHHEKKFDYQCQDCGVKFMSQTDLTVHTRKHTGEREYFDPWLNNSNLIVSIPGPFKCEFCSKTFASKHTYRFHQSTHVPKTFECKKCEMSFPTVSFHSITF